MKKERSKRKIKYDISVLAAFVLSSVTMLIFCAFTKFRTGEISSLQAGDMLNLYVPAIRSFVRNLYSGQGLNYSWDLFLGMNAVPYYTSVMGGSIINLVYILFPFISPEIFVLLAIVIKTGMVGACFTYYSKKVLKSTGIIPVVFSLFYAVCGFQVCVNIVNYIWIDLLYLLPLIICAIHSMVEERKWKSLVWLYAYSFLCCFYIAYIVGIFSALYVVLYIVIYRVWKINGIKGVFGRLFQYAGVVLWAAAMGAFALIPTAIFLMTKFPPDATVATSDLVQSNIILLLSRFFVGIGFTQYFNLPFLYCGIPSLLLLPMFFISKKINRKQKVLYGVLLGIMIFSCINLPLYIMWHGFDAPDGWDFRFSFIIAFLVVSMACKAAQNIHEEINKKIVLIGLVEDACICGILYYCNQYGDRAYMAPANWNLIFLVCWSICGALLLIIKLNKRWKATFLVVLAMLEVLVNGGLQHDTFKSQKELDVFSKEARTAINLLNGDTSFYRIQTENSLHENADSYWGYKGIADLCSFENYEVRNCLYQLGFYASPRYMTGYGLNPITQMLLGVKYRVHFSEKEEEEFKTSNIAYYEQYLGMGFLVNEKIVDFSFEEDVFENCNQLASAMAGEKIELFTATLETDVEITEAGIGLEYQDATKYTIKRTDDSSNVVQLIFAFPNTGRDIYGMTKAFTIGNIPGRPYIYEMFHSKDRGSFGMKYTKKLDVFGEKLIYDIVMERGVTEDQDTFINYQFSYLNQEEVEKLYCILKENCLEVEEYHNGYVFGDIYVKDNNLVLFTSIPYDSGWKLNVKDKNTGRKVTTANLIPLLDGAFIGIDFEETGEYEISLKYRAPGASLGLMISVIAIMLYVSKVIYEKVRNVHKDKEDL